MSDDAPSVANESTVEVAHIAAMSTERGIGIKNGLPWHISEDLKRFKRLTTGAVILMGRKTFESFGARPLPNRHHIVVTNNPEYQIEHESVTVMHSIEAAIAEGKRLSAQMGQPTLWVIGGAQIYQQTLDFAERLELTLVSTTPECDAFYPDIPSSFAFAERAAHTDPDSALKYQFVTLKRQPANQT